MDYQMSELRESILECMKRYPNGVSREQLELATGCSDRKVRREIEAMRKAHFPIGNASIKGYTYGANDGLRHTIADMRSRALNLLNTASALEKCLTIEGQEKISL